MLIDYCERSFSHYKKINEDIITCKTTFDFFIFLFVFILIFVFRSPPFPLLFFVLFVLLAATLPLNPVSFSVSGYYFTTDKCEFGSIMISRPLFHVEKIKQAANKLLAERSRRLLSSVTQLFGDTRRLSFQNPTFDFQSVNWKIFKIFVSDIINTPTIIFNTQH